MSAAEKERLLLGWFFFVLFFLLGLNLFMFLCAYLMMTESSQFPGSALFSMEIFMSAVFWALSVQAGQSAMKKKKEKTENASELMLVSLNYKICIFLCYIL